MTLRAALYARVSTDRQATDDKNSLPVQRARFAAWCQEHDADPAGEFVDTDTGQRSSRTEYQRMLTAARRGAFDAVVVRHLDRFGRDQWEIMSRLAELRALTVQVAATDESLDHFMVIAAKAFAADHEAKRLGERVRSARVRQAGLGRYTGRVPFGYRSDAGRLVVDPAPARTVRRIFAMLLEENMGGRAIAIRLNAEAVPSPTGRRWSAQGVYKLLRRAAYAGDVVFAGVVTGDQHQPIIDRATFDRAQERLARHATMPGGRTQRSTWLLSGLARCGYCTGPMYGVVTRQGRRRYQCGRKMADGGCDQWNRQDADVLETAVLDALSAGAPGVEEAVEVDVVDLAADEVDRLEAEVERLDEELRANLDLYRAEAMTLDQLRIANQQTHDHRTAAAAALDAAQATHARLAERRRRRLDAPALVALRRAIETMPALQAKAELQGVVQSVRVTGDHLEVTLL